MEIALPIIALGSLYIVSNQSNKEGMNIKNKNNKQQHNRNDTKKEEGFTNMGKNNISSNEYLPNTNIITQNYPTINNKEIGNNVNKYDNPNVATDKYFNQTVYENNENSGVNVGQNIQQVYSLTGNYMNSAEFKHNNMKPFYGGKVKGQVYHNNIAESVLDNMIGSGSQTIKKIEQAPLFKPESNVQYPYGTPNQSDFFQSRVVPGTRNHMVKPFESVRVGPGLNQGFGSNGSNGFNSGMESRDTWLPKTVDELRISTNPKQEYSLDGLEGPAQNNIKMLGSIGRVEKYAPDTFFINTQDRWLTTTGSEKAGQLLPHQIVKETARIDTTQSYQGVASSAHKNGNYNAGVYEPAKRNELGPKDVGNSTAVGKGPIETNYALGTYDMLNNNRSMNQQSTPFRSGFSNAIGAVIAPLFDVLRPTKKSELCGVNVLGGTKSAVSSNYVIDPNDTTKTTNKEMDLYSSYGYVGNQGDASYVNNERPVSNVRDTTTCPGFIGPVGGIGNNYGAESYEMYQNQTNNDKKQTMEWANQGNMNMFNPNNNYTLTRSDTAMNQVRNQAPKNIISVPPGVEQYGKIHTPQYYDECHSCKQIDPEILNAFRSNPYTFSLSSY